MIFCSSWRLFISRKRLRSSLLNYVYIEIGQTCQVINLSLCSISLNFSFKGRAFNGPQLKKILRNLDSLEEKLGNTATAKLSIKYIRSLENLYVEVMR